MFIVFALLLVVVFVCRGEGRGSGKARIEGSLVIALGCAVPRLAVPCRVHCSPTVASSSVPKKRLAGCLLPTEAERGMRTACKHTPRPTLGPFATSLRASSRRCFYRLRRVDRPSHPSERPADPARQSWLVGAGHEAIINGGHELLLVAVGDAEHHHAVLDGCAVEMVERHVLRHRQQSAIDCGRRLDMTHNNERQRYAS
jgi:hypothetical protein